MAMARMSSGLQYPERFYAAASYVGFDGSPRSSAKAVRSKFKPDTALLLYALHQQVRLQFNPFSFSITPLGSRSQSQCQIYVIRGSSFNPSSSCTKKKKKWFYANAVVDFLAFSSFFCRFVQWRDRIVRFPIVMGWDIFSLLARCAWCALIWCVYACCFCNFWCSSGRSGILRFSSVYFGFWSVILFGSWENAEESKWFWWWYRYNFTSVVYLFTSVFNMVTIWSLQRLKFEPFGFAP